MTEATERPEQAANFWWWLTLTYAGLVGLLWLYRGMSRLLQWRTYMATAEMVAAQGDLERAGQIQAFAGSVVVDMGYALITAAIFAFAAFALLRRSWNAWDYVTVVVGFVVVLSLIFLCARNRIMFFIPLSSMPLLALLYTPGVKAACGVKQTDQAATPEAEQVPIAALSPGEIEQEIAKERALIAQLSQNLDVFEVERGMDTDTFVERYANGLEEETPDSAEWFSIARAVRRGRERIAELKTQLNVLSDGHQR